MTDDVQTATELDRVVDSLDPAQWRAVRPAVHLIAQLLGKIALAASPFRNHWWECALALTPQGFRTPLLTAPGAGIRGMRFDIEVDLTSGCLTVRTPVHTTAIALDGSITIAQLFHQLRTLFTAAGIDLTLDPTTSELPTPVRLDEDSTTLAIATPAARAWLAQLHAIDAAYGELLQDYAGKASGGVLWWGALDYALSLFNGKPHTPPAGSSRIYRFAEDAENITFSYWTDDAGHPELCAYRMPGGASDAGGDYGYGAWSHDRGEVVCALTPTGQVAAHPVVGSLTTFLAQTTRALASAGGWDLDALLGSVPAGVGTDVRIADADTGAAPA